MYVQNEKSKENPFWDLLWSWNVSILFTSTSNMKLSSHLPPNFTSSFYNLCIFLTQWVCLVLPICAVVGPPTDVGGASSSSCHQSWAIPTPCWNFQLSWSYTGPHVGAHSCFEFTCEQHVMFRGQHFHNISPSLGSYILSALLSTIFSEPCMGGWELIMCHI